MTKSCPTKELSGSKKGQAEVEGRFRYLKSPHQLGLIYLHRADRVKALFLPHADVLILYSALEYILRETMQHEKHR
jgi:transposase